MTDLSPQAQAIIDAADEVFSRGGRIRDGFAAALRAIVEQLMYVDDDGDMCINPEYILDIAEELEKI